MYETERDLANEQEIASEFARRMRCDARKLKRFYPVDFALIERRSQRVVAFAEVKDRHNRRTEYPSLMLSLHKWQALVQHDPHAEMGSLIVVRWTDVPLAYYVVRDTPHPPRARWGGREDRNNPDDKEPVIDLPVSAFEVP